MKCKRCRAHVADDTDVCPLCGQDLTALRQLLRDFYDGGPPPGEEESPSLPVNEEKSFEQDQSAETLGREEPRIILRGQGPVLDFSSGPDEFEAGAAQEEAGLSAAIRTPEGGFWLRFMAFVTDQLVLVFIITIFIAAAFIAMGFGAPAGRMEISFVKQARTLLPALLPFIIVLGLVYFSFFHAAFGQTVGKMIFGLRVIRQDGECISFPRGVARSCAYVLSAVPFGFGFLWVAFSAEKKGWHDLLIGTRVIRNR